MGSEVISGTEVIHVQRAIQADAGSIESRNPDQLISIGPMAGPRQHQPIPDLPVQRFFIEQQVPIPLPRWPRHCNGRPFRSTMHKRLAMENSTSPQQRGITIHRQGTEIGEDDPGGVIGINRLSRCADLKTSLGRTDQGVDLELRRAERVKAQGSIQAHPAQRRRPTLRQRDHNTSWKVNPGAVIREATVLPGVGITPGAGSNRLMAGLSHRHQVKNRHVLLGKHRLILMGGAFHHADGLIQPKCLAGILSRGTPSVSGHHGQS